VDPAPRAPRSERAARAPLLGAVLLCALALWSLPWKEGVGRPRTPLDRSTSRALRPGYVLLTEAVGVLPVKASVVVRTEPPDAMLETWYHRLAVALLPGRRILPAAWLGRFTAPEIWSEAEYLVVVGPKPRGAAGELVLETPSGTVWRRSSP